MTPAIPLTRLGATARIGLLSDTRCHGPGASDLPGSVLDAFRGVDLVVHLGDMGDVAVLDRLAGVAGVAATRGRDDPPEDARLAPTARVIEAGDLVLGALFDLTTVGLAALEGDRLDFSGGLSAKVMQRVFGRRVDVVAFGATHRDLVALHRGILFVNPGSATLPARTGAGALGTAAVLELRAAVATVEIIRI
jgi:putative phosphoesterase